MIRCLKVTKIIYASVRGFFIYLLVKLLIDFLWNLSIMPGKVTILGILNFWNDIFWGSLMFVFSTEKKPQNYATHLHSWGFWKT